MPKKLPKGKLTKSLKIHSSEIQEIKYLYLFYRGKSYLRSETFFTKLWLVNIDSPQYPIQNFGNKVISLEVLTVNIKDYIDGSIYDDLGNCISQPRLNTMGLTELEIDISTEEDYFSNGLFLLLNSTSYPIPDFKFEVLKGAYYYKKEIILLDKKITVIIPLQIIIDFFFFSYSTKLNNYILNNTIKDLFKVNGEIVHNGKIYGSVTQDGQRISKKLVLLVSRYFFTTGKKGIEALTELRSSHLINMINGKKETYLNSKIPFSYDCNFKLIGQYIGSESEIFLANRIVGFKPSEGQPLFNVEEIIVNVDNDTRRAKKANNEGNQPYNKINNDVNITSSSDLDQTDSDGSSNNEEIIKEEEPMYSFGEIPDHKTVKKESKDYNRVLKLVINGEKYTGGTTNLRGLGGEKKNIKIDEITRSLSVPWNIYALKAIEKFCKKNNCNGTFIKLDIDNPNISLAKYRKGYLNIYSSFMTKKFKKFKFILFEFSFKDRFFYFYERGSGSYSALFRSEHSMRMDHNKMNEFFNGLVFQGILRWSSKRKDKKFLKKYKVHIYQPMEHRKASKRAGDNIIENIIDDLVENIENRVRKDFIKKTLDNK